jgi:hypothetical protein
MLYALQENSLQEGGQGQLAEELQQQVLLLCISVV